MPPPARGVEGEETVGVDMVSERGCPCKVQDG